MYHYEIHVTLFALLIMYGAFAYLKLLPSMGVLHDFSSMIDTKGGNILILVVLVFYFYHDTARTYVHLLELINTGKITADNGIALNALTFSTGAFGAVSGALLKVMSGSEPTIPKVPPEDPAKEKV